MPWEINKIGGKFCVIKQGGSEPEGCFPTRAEAIEQMKALYSSESNLAANISYSVGDIEDAVAHLKLAIAALAGDSRGDLSVHLEEALAALGEYGDVEPDPLLARGDVQEFSWSGPIVFENIITGDNRVFKSDSIKWEAETLPWSFRWQKASGQGHAGSVPVGRVDKIERKEDGSIFGYGVVIPSLSEEAGEYLRLLQSDAGGGVSVDGDSAQFEVQEMAEGGQPRIEFSSMRLRALSAVDIPAFNGARIKLSEPMVELAEEAEAVEEVAIDTAEPELAQTEGPEEPEFVEIEVNEPNLQLGVEIEDSDPELSELEQLEMELESLYLEAEAEIAAFERETLRHQDLKPTGMRHGWNVDQSLVAAAIPVTPSVESFVDPDFEGPTALTISPDGKVAGHLALFNTCHIAFPGACVKPPKGSNYQYFHTGEVETSEGDLVSVGHLTFKTGHAAMNDSPKAAAEHYDNTGTVAADVRAGEDQFGIWVVGALRNHLSEEDIRAFRSAPLSGDWRRIAGRLELVGALAVNVPGFPVPRVKALVASGETETLLTYLEDGDENFPTDYNDRLDAKMALSQRLGIGVDPIDGRDLNERLDAKIALAQRIELFENGDDSEEVPTEKVPDDDLPDVPTKKELEEYAKSMTKAQILAALKDVRDLLDDDEAKMSARDRKMVERLYSTFISTDEKGKKTDASGMDVEAFYSAWELSGVDIEEFYNSCHGSDGRFCETPGGEGVAGKSGYKGGRNQNRNRNRNQNQNQNKPPSVVDEAKGYRRSKDRAKRWGAVAALGFALQHSDVARSIVKTVVSPLGVPIFGTPAFAAVLVVAGLVNLRSNWINARKYKTDMNRSIDRINKSDREKRDAERRKTASRNTP